jgi:membrane protein DedA with SNARE-associated domain
MEAFIEHAAEFIRQNHAWAGPIIGLMTLGESLFIIGILIPGTALLLILGGLVASGALPVLPILLWGFAGALLGDALSFWLGRWMGPSVLRCKPLATHRRTVARARLLFYRYGFFAVLIGRFLGPIRSTMPTVAGVMGMPEYKFQFANLISALFWVPALLAPGHMAINAATSFNLFKLF